MMGNRRSVQHTFCLSQKKFSPSSASHSNSPRNQYEHRLLCGPRLCQRDTRQRANTYCTYTGFLLCRIPCDPWPRPGTFLVHCHDTSLWPRFRVTVHKFPRVRRFVGIRSPPSHAYRIKEAFFCSFRSSSLPHFPPWNGIPCLAFGCLDYRSTVP
jgi:hypothetical protein